MGLLTVGGILVLCGCAREGPLATDPAVATRQASELIPKGTSEARAKALLIERGFELSRLNSDDAENHLIVGMCTRQEHTWLVGVVVVRGRVVACSVTVTKLA